MTTITEVEPDVAERTSPRSSRRMRARARTALSAHGEPAVWLLGGSLIVSLVMIAGLLGVVFTQGLATFWPSELVSYEVASGDVLMGEVRKSETYSPQDNAELDEAALTRLDADRAANDGEASRLLLRTGNFDLTGTHFHWVNRSDIVDEQRPEWGVVVERLNWGRFYGEPVSFNVDGEVVAEGPSAAWEEFEKYHADSRDRFHERRALEKDDVGALNHRLESARIELRLVELEHGIESDEWSRENARFLAIEAEANTEFETIQARIAELNAENARYGLVMRTAEGAEKELQPAEIVRAYPANQLGFGQKLVLYLSRWVEFLVAGPREANSEGGVFPAIFGTVVMTLLMTIVVVPFGVLAALYLREYAKQGVIVSAVRIAVNNLAGVPSIVFGVFGLGFFCYMVGGSIDELFFSAKLPSPTFGTGGVMWASLTLALLTLPVVIVATEESLSAVPNSMREGSFACGATKWQTIRRIVLPRAAPGIMTGAILAIARGAGEVAPLMMVGAVKLAPELPIDGVYPFVHPERSFMHLGFHIFDLGFQSQNSEAAKPMVYTTTLLLIVIIVALNLLAIWGRARLRRRFHGNSI